MFKKKTKEVIETPADLELKVLEGQVEAEVQVDESDKVEILPPVSLVKLYSFATTTDLLILLTATLCAVLNGVSQPLMTLVFSGVVGLFSDYYQQLPIDPQIARQSLQSEVNWLCMLFVIIGAVTLVTAYGQLSLFMISGERQAVRIRHHYYRSILSQEVGWFDSNQSGDISSRIAGDVNLVQEGISDKIGLFIQYTTTFFSGFILAFTKGWKLTLVLLSVVPILVACGVFIGKLIAEDSAEGQGAYGQAGSVAEEVLSAIRTVYSFNGQKAELVRYESKLKVALKKGHRKAIINGLGIGVILAILFLSYGLGMWYGAKLIAEENYTSEEVLAVFFSVLIGATSIGQASPALTALATALGAAAKLFQVIDRQSQINPFTTTETMREVQANLGQVKGTIRFQNISFSYPTRPDVPVLRDVSLNINPGTTVALVGSSGSGKSTLVSLIERFYDPEQGQILLDGVNIQDFSVKFLREHIGIVGQEPILFATTIKQNILYGLRDDKEIDHESPEIHKRVEEACKMANIHDFIATLPQGYQTMVGEKGSLLSGGQKQRVAIARALIRDPRILLLDEATSALDTESEKLVQRALDNAAKNRTTIVIAHRLSTIRHADKIVVFDKGVIVEQGTHDELIHLNSVYAHLVNSQALRTGGEDEPVTKLPKTNKVNSTLFIPTEDVSGDAAKDIAKLMDGSLSTEHAVQLIASLKEKRLAKEPVPMLRVLKMIKPWFLLVLVGLIGSLVDGAIFPIYSLIFTRMAQAYVDIVTPGLEASGRSDADFWALMFVVLGVVSFFVNLARVGALEYVGESLTFLIRRNSFEALLQQEVAYFDDPTNSVGILAAKLSTEAEQIKELVSRILGHSFAAISTAAVGLGLAFSGGWKLTLVVLATTPVVAIANFAEMKVLTKVNRQTKKAYENVSQIASESIVNMRTLASLNREEVFYQDYVTLVSKAHKSAVSGSLKAAFGYSLVMGTPFLVNAIAFWYGTTLVVSGEYSFLEMFQVITAVLFTGMALGSSSAHVNTYVKSKVAAIDLFELLDRKPAISSNPEAGEKVCRISGNVQFQNAHFAYPSRKDTPILQGLDLEIIEGKNVALVGSSGSGKSTVIALAQRFYDLTAGSLQVEGTCIKKWNVPYLRSEMAVVGQEPVLFDLTIQQNIAYGKPDATLDQVEAAAKMANAHTFITQQPDGYQTKVGERGGQLSGGQKQRVALARALIRDPKLLLLDEATSALDSESEKVVQAALDLASQDRTTITIAHRLSTIQDSDLIIVMREGKVVERGTHDTLLNLKGYYYSLVNQQQLNLA